MRYFILFGLCFLKLFAFSFVVNSGKDNVQTYYALHLQDSSEIVCESEILSLEKQSYTCLVNSTLDDKVVSQNLPFAEIKFEKKDKQFLVKISPKSSSRIVDFSKELFLDKKTIIPQSLNSKHIAILIDKFDKIPLNNGINFPILYPNLLTPSIGALDISKEPLKQSSSGDIPVYLNLKKAYENKDYRLVISEANKAIENYQGSIFYSEFYLYKIRALSAMDIDDDKERRENLTQIIEDGKKWMRRFAVDGNYPEMLYIVTRAYLEQDLLSDANYTIDTLITEHPKSKWTKMAILEFANYLYNMGKNNEAIKMYEDVLYSAQDIDVASSAAFKLAGANIAKKQFSLASEYIKKVILANQDYIKKNRTKSYEMANSFKENSMIEVANSIYKILVDDEIRDNIYEISLKSLGLGLILQESYQDAYDYLKRYEREFKEGDYLEEVLVGLDRLFFEINDSNSTKLHSYYDTLMSKYDNDIGAKALQEKIKLGFKEGNFSLVLSYSDKILDANDSVGIEILRNSALNLTNSALQNGDCKDVVRLTEKYELTNLIKDEFKLFNCFIRLKRHQSAINLASKHIKDSDLEDRVEWLVNLSQALYESGKFQDCIKACDEALNIAAKLPYADPSRAILYRFYSLMKLDNFPEAVSSIRALEDLLEDDVKLVEVYFYASKFALDKNRFSLSSAYANRCKNLQNKLKISTFSPEIDFVLITSLMKNSELKEAKDANLELLKTSLDPQNRARALSLMAEIYLQLNEKQEAKDMVLQCLKIPINSPWKDICSEQKLLFKE